MSLQIIQKKLNEYNARSTEEEENAIKEITQEIALLALSRANFFKEAIFHGGTCLRILHGLNRFSEDLDFALTKPNTKFNFNQTLTQLTEEFRIYGYDLEIQDRSKADLVVKKAFLKDGSLGKQLNLSYPFLSGGQRKIRIKLEVDTNPPPNGTSQLSYHNFPLPFPVATYDLPSLFSGKLHALLCREYVKGRDWYDLLWYMRFNVQPNLSFLHSALIQSGNWVDKEALISNSWVKTNLEHKINSLDWGKAKEDILRFVKTEEIDSISHWGPELFLGVVSKLN